MQKYILVNVQNVSINGRSQLVNGLCYLRQRAGPPDVPSVTVAGCFGKDKKRGKVKRALHQGAGRVQGSLSTLKITGLSASGH